jgi:hypothetical protein
MMSKCIRTNHAMYLPAHLVSLYTGTCHTPWEALMRVQTAHSKLGDLEMFKPLLDCLCMAITRDNTLAIKQASGLTSPIKEDCLHKRLIQLVKQDLPGWQQFEVSTPERKQDLQIATWKNSWRTSCCNSNLGVHQPLPVMTRKIQANFVGRGQSTSSSD